MGEEEDRCQKKAEMKHNADHHRYRVLGQDGVPKAPHVLKKRFQRQLPE
jgi:hypothetical protein